MTGPILEPPQQAAAPAPAQVRFGLSWKLLLLTGLFVMVSGVLIFVPSVANFREAWLGDRLAAAEAAAVVLTASDRTHVPRRVQDDLLASVGAIAIAVRSGEVSRLLATVETPPAVDRTSDLREMRPLMAVVDALDTLFAPRARTLRVIGETSRGATIEIVMNDAALRAAMLAYSFNMLLLSLVISILAAALVFFSINRILIAPMQRMSSNMTSFSGAPEDASRIIEPSGRTDEIGVAEDHLAAMQRELQATLQHQRRLADLGLAVSKINHDLRNMLAAAQLLSDRLTALPDPTVQTFAPKLIAAIDRAISYCENTLSYGRPTEETPQRRLVLLHRLVEDVAEILGLDSPGTIRWENNVPAELEIDADPDQLFRVLLNLCRNSMQAMEGDREPAVIRRICVEAKRAGSVVTLHVRDSGPGVPEKARANLFRAFQGGARSGGTGLGLAIAAELVRAHGGTIALIDSSAGAAFEIVIADRPLAFHRGERAHAG
jgi:signal transduction histidine kinase